MTFFITPPIIYEYRHSSKITVTGGKVVVQEEKVGDHPVIDVENPNETEAGEREEEREEERNGEQENNEAEEDPTAGTSQPELNEL